MVESALENFNSVVSDARAVPPKLLRIEIIDTGIGMSDEDQKNLFQQFGKLKTSYHIN